MCRDVTAALIALLAFFWALRTRLRAGRRPVVVSPVVNHGGMHRIEVAERRRRLAVRHALAPAQRVNGTPPDPAQVARQLVALHSTDPATVYLSVLARVAAPVPARVIEESLYDRQLAVPAVPLGAG